MSEINDAITFDFKEAHTGNVKENETKSVLYKRRKTNFRRSMEKKLFERGISFLPLQNGTSQTTADDQGNTGTMANTAENDE